ncbi:MAG: tetratricopeptide repeat protein [Candidatus Cloacimonetes bacterium]|nr:tetratricopeptide repeat protein [Candidatus Cloacimonadota bacterium]
MSEDFLKSCLDKAISHHQHNETFQAQIYYLKVLDIDPSNLTALYLLGTLECSVKNFKSSCESFQRYLKIDPKNQEVHNNLSLAYMGLKDYINAEYSLRRAIELNPHYKEAWNNFANLYKQQKEYNKAIECYMQAISIDINYIDAQYNCALLNHEIGETKLAKNQLIKVIHEHQHKESQLLLANIYKGENKYNLAKDIYLQVLEEYPRCLPAYNNISSILIDENNLDQAQIYLEIVINLDPNYGEAYNNLAIVTRLKKDFEKSFYYAGIAIRFNEDEPLILNNYALALLHTNQIDLSIKRFERCIHLDPKSPIYYQGLSLAYQHKLDYPKAIECLNQALNIKQDDPISNFNKSILLLTLNQFKEGFSLHQYKNHVPNCAIPKVDFDCDQKWAGEPNHHILVYMEQGFGDFILYSRFLKLLKQKFTLLVHPSIYPLAKFQGLADHIISDPMDAPSYESYCAIEDLPSILKVTSIDSTPYYEQKFSAQNCRKKIGLVYCGNPQHTNDHNRSIPFDLISNMCEGLDADFISLQINSSDDFGNSNIIDVSQSISNFKDTSHLLETLDLFISVDTSVLHLAGALGVKSWALVPFVPDWRWGLVEKQSHWYDSIEIIRQLRIGSWDNTLKSVKEKLNRFIKNEI